MDTVAWFLFLGGLLAGCRAMEVSCRVTVDDSKTTYSIDSTLDDCYEYSFTNATKHVLAHATDQEPMLVIRRNMSTLVTSQCMESITYHCSCISQEGVVHAITSNCSTACSGRLEGGKGENGSPPETSSKWIAVAVGLTLVVLFVGVLAFLFFKFRKKSCSPHQCMYTDDI